MKLQELTSKAGINVKHMSQTVKKAVYPDYYFSFFSSPEHEVKFLYTYIMCVGWIEFLYKLIYIHVVIINFLIR